jgi:hypothetical protein
MSKLSDPLKVATLRGFLRRKEMLEAAGGALTPDQVAKILALSTETVDKRRSSNQLLAVPRGVHGFSYPRFQFDDGKTLAGLEDALEVLRAVDPWMQLNFFTTSNGRLDGKTPIEALRSGEIDQVVKMANIYGEQGAL